jgi:hypothetical protein
MEGLGHLVSTSIKEIIVMLLKSSEVEFVEGMKLNPSLNVTSLQIFSLSAAGSELLLVCMRLDSTANFSAYIGTALELCCSNKDNSEDEFNIIGMKVIDPTVPSFYSTA